MLFNFTLEFTWAIVNFVDTCVYAAIVEECATHVEAPTKGYNCWVQAHWFQNPSILKRYLIMILPNVP